MASVSNAPDERVVIRAEARKSLSFAVWLKDERGAGVDITGTTLRIVARKRDAEELSDSDNIFATNELAELVAPLVGYARFSLQASDLDLRSGEYPFSIVLIDNGYSSVIAKGIIEVDPNTDVTSVEESYTPANVSTTLQVLLRDRIAINVRTGSTLTPGAVTFTTEHERKLGTVEEGAQVNVRPNWQAGDDDPAAVLNKPVFGTAAFVDIDAIAIPRGGAPGEFLVKRSSSDFDVTWSFAPGGGGGGGALDATGVPDGYLPTANGVDGWGWKPPVVPVSAVNGKTGSVTLNQDEVPDGTTRVAMTPAERTKLFGLTPTPDYSSIQNTPVLGTIASENEDDFIRKGQGDASDLTSGVVDPARLPTVSEHRGFSSGTGTPVGGADGDLYFQFMI